MDTRLKKGQIAIEYMLLISFLMMVTTVVMYFLALKLGEVEHENKGILTDNIFQIVNDNLQVGLAATDGYKAFFILPGQVNNVNLSYQISNFNNFYINHIFDSTPYSLPNNTVGSLCFNRSLAVYPIAVEKNNGLISITSCLNCTVTFERCYAANLTNTCGLLPAATRAQCSQYHCIC